MCYVIYFEIHIAHFYRVLSLHYYIRYEEIIWMVSNYLWNPLIARINTYVIQNP